MASHREARVKHAYRAWYPKIDPSLWHQAAPLARIVAYHRGHSSPRWSLEGRPLPDAHFEFRRGDPPRLVGWSGPPSREGDEELTRHEESRSWPDVTR